MGTQRGQVAVEYMALLGTLLLGLVFLGYYQLDDTRIGIEVATAQDAIESLARSADTVYAIGPCSRTYTHITLPKGINPLLDPYGGTEGFYQGPHMVKIVADFGNGPTDIISPTKGKIQGYIPAIDRGYKMQVFQTCSGVIQIGQDLELSDEEIRATIAGSGSLDTVDLTLTSSRDISIDSLNIYTDGIAGEWTAVTGLESSIAAGGSDDFSVDITVPGGTNPGTYTGWVIINGTGAIIELHEIITVT
ncbi:MAG: hypothetical protein KKD39_02140 [Candidatus Altiarchaeota archaeon]|nr:hypothetical protein [Candidatus Altiarchaeota archaeon]